LKQATARRALWTRFFFNDGPSAFAAGGAAAAICRLHELLAGISAEEKLPGRVTFVSVTQGDPELLTLKARKALQHAGTIFHDRAVSKVVLDLARREAAFEERRTGSDARMAQAAVAGQDIVCLTSVPDAGTFQHEIVALDAAGIAWEILPGVPSAVVASAGEDRSAATAQKPEGRNIIPLPAAATGRTASPDGSQPYLRTGAL